MPSSHPPTNPSPIAPAESLLITHPLQLAAWHPIYNQNLHPQNFTGNSPQVVWWLCQRNIHHSYQLSIAQQLASATNCEYCCPFCRELDKPETTQVLAQTKERDATPAGNLTKTHPSIAAQWDSQKNHPQKPEYVKPFSNEKFWWLCPLGHSFIASAKTRTFSYTADMGCPHCAQLPIVKFNELSKSTKQLSPVNDEKNQADKRRSGTTKDAPNIFFVINEEVKNSPAKWQCRKNSTHLFNDELFLRIIGSPSGPRCTYCALEKERPNSFYNRVLPHLAKEFSGRNLVSILAIKPASNYQVWWTCSHCGGEWQATPQERYYSTNECTACKSAKIIENR